MDIESSPQKKWWFCNRGRSYNEGIIYFHPDKTLLML